VTSRCAVCDAERLTPIAGPPARWQYLACDVCGHASLAPMPSDAELREYYNTAYAVQLDAHVASARRQADTVTTALGERAPGSMLEVGCSYGAVLAEFRARGWRVEGIELDARAAAWGREQLGVPVHAGALAQVRDALHPPYDVIGMYHVIEHVPEPLETLAMLRTLLAPNGVLVLRTPNVRSAIARLTRGWWEWSVVPAHVHLFSPESLARLLTRAGLVPEAPRTLRGDAAGFVTELLRAGVRRAVPRAAGRPAIDESASHEVGHGIRPRFTGARRALDVIGAPLDAAVTWAGRHGLPGGAELLMAARPA
jgi:SAM-dependent methyltransferase